MKLRSCGPKFTLKYGYITFAKNGVSKGYGSPNKNHDTITLCNDSDLCNK